MFYDMNKIIADELALSNHMLSEIQGQTDIPRGMSLYGNATTSGLSYHLRYLENGVRKSKNLGDDTSPDVIKIKQLFYNKELASRLEHNMKLLMRVDGRFLQYDSDHIDAALGTSYRDNTGMVNKNPGFMSSDEWLKQQYSSTLPTAEKTHITADGKTARSKSELVLHNILTQLGIPFKNDVDINLRTETGEKVYKNADFVMPGKHGEYIILEHFGMLDSEDYLLRAIHKIRIYGLNGYTLNDRLFISMDGFNGSLNAQALRDMIEKLILPKVMV